MARSVLPMGLEGAEHLPQTRRVLTNCFNNGQGQILPRPGIAQLGVDFNFQARGTFTWNGFLYMVFGNDLQRIDNVLTGAFTTIGFITGSAIINTAVGFNDAVIVVKGIATYTLSKTDILTDISNNLNFVPVVGVTHIDGRFVYIPANGDPAFFSDIGAAGTVQGTSFFDAEELPDLNNSVFNLANTLVIGGTDSFELFRDVGTSPTNLNPYRRISGARQRYGFIGALLEYTNSFLFLGREKDQDFGFYALGAGQTVKISNAFVDEVLSTYAPEELADCVPGRIKWRGYDIATFSLARESFGFLKGNWFRLETLVQGVSRPWVGGFIAQYNGIYYTSSKKQMGKFENIDNDFGEMVQRVIELGFKHPNDERFSCQSVQLGISQGFNAAVGSIGLFVSADNVLYGPGLFESLGAQGEYSKMLDWNPPGGLGNYDGFMGIRIYTTQDLVFAADSLYLNIR